MSITLLRTAMVVAAAPLVLGLGAPYFHQSTMDVMLLVGATVAAAALASRAMRRTKPAPLRLLGVLRQMRGPELRDRAKLAGRHDGAASQPTSAIYFEAIVPAAAAGRLQSGMQANIRPLRGSKTDCRSLAGQVVSLEEQCATEGYAPPQHQARVVRIELGAVAAHDLGDLRLGTPALAELTAVPVEVSTDSTTLEWLASSSDSSTSSDA